VLKRILASLLADPQFRNQMIDEAHVAMSLNHSTSFRCWISATREADIFSCWNWWRAGTSTKS